MANCRRQIFMLVASLSCLLLDLGSKYWAHNYLPPGERQVLIPGFINLTLVSNTGFAFSLGQGQPLIAQVISLCVFLLLLLFYIGRYLYLTPVDSARLDQVAKTLHSPAHSSPLLRCVETPWLEQLGMSIILGSAAGNLVERLCYGKVTDFFEFAFINFPVFNAADALIDAGIVLVLISAYRCKK